MSRLMIICGPIVSAAAGEFICLAFTFLGREMGKMIAGAVGLKFPDGPSASETGDDKKGDEKGSGKKGGDSAPLSRKASKRQMKAKPNSAVKLSSFTAEIKQSVIDTITAEKHAHSRMAATILAFLFLVYYTVVGGLQFFAHSTQVARSLSSPQIVFKWYNRQTGQEKLIDDYYKTYLWIKDNTPEDARVLSWWDYGYQINGIANRTTIADGNTWNHEHIATLGRCMVSPEKRSWNIIRHIADYVLVWAGGSGDDLGKSIHMARISTSVYDDVCPNDPTCDRFGFGHDGKPTEMMTNSLVYKLVKHGFEGTRANSRLFTEVHTSEHGLIRVFKVTNTSAESKEWIKNNKQCDGGGWYCPGQYPPALDKLFAKKKNFAQLEDFNSGTKEKNAYSKHIDEQNAKR